MSALISPAGAIARRHDPDRFLFALFSPPERREAIFTLIAFNHELARALDIAAVRGGEYSAMGGHVRLQWWRDLIERGGTGHQIAAPLLALIETGPLDRGALLGLIDGRAAELDGLDEADWLDALQAGPGALARNIGRILDLPAAALDAVTSVGTAFAIGKILRHLPTLRALERRPLPYSLMHATDHAALIDQARALLAPARHLRLPRSQRAAILPAILARRDLDRAASGRQQDQPRGVADRLAVASAALTGRV